MIVTKKYNLVRVFLIIIVSMVIQFLNAQDLIEGRVTYKSSVNVYVKLNSTKGVEVGDTLFFYRDSLIPVLVVKYISSSSCVGTKISDRNFNISDVILVRTRKLVEVFTQKDSLILTENTFSIDSNASAVNNQVVAKEKPKHRFYGRLSLSTYSTLNNLNSKKSNRVRYTFSASNRLLANKGWSWDAYINYRQQISGSYQVSKNFFDNLNLYNLAARYDFGPNSNITFGRKVNLNISNIGAIDGFQYEHKFKNVVLGTILGSRPDYSNYSVNASLQQVGLYINHTLKGKQGSFSNTLAIIEQKNRFKTDRRFLYYQMSSMLIKNMMLFGSFEMELYQKIKEVTKNTLSPSSVYLSLRYKLSNKLSFNSSYDALKNVIYYESYKSLIDQYIEREMRQGFRFGFNYDPAKMISIGSNFAYRFQANRKDPSRNMDYYLNFYQLPLIKSALNISYTALSTDYLSGKIFGLTMTKDVGQGKYYLSGGYRSIQYQYEQNELPLDQHIFSMNINWQLLKKLSLGLNYEGTFEKSRNYTSIFCNLIKRF